ncbi:MAG: DUF1801 domain-containing protein [Caulobacter sp.]|nr:DUF1801 domain-containing protein [Caulobacter sp.]
MGPGLRRDERGLESNPLDSSGQAPHLSGVTLFLLPSARQRDPTVEAWFEAADPLRDLVRPWFDRIRALGPDIRELIHDHAPTACVGEAAFVYTAAFSAHAAIGFFHGADLADPHRLLEGSGKRMRHLKLRPGRPSDDDAIAALLDAAYADIRARL